jgi:tRNA 2-thiocytidine biosynthesis protein TtcA
VSNSKTQLLLRRDNAEKMNKLQKKLRRLVGNAVVRYGMIEDGDRIMVCLSGGKDSYTLLDMLMSLQHNAPASFELVAVNLDQKQPGFPEDVLPAYLDTLGVKYHVLEQDTYSIVKELTPEGKTFCAVCSRLRRGALYRLATNIGASKIALGHHADDAVETLFLNLFHGSKMKAMPPKLRSDDGRHMVIRPLYFIREKDISQWASYRKFPIIPCDLCGSQKNLERAKIKAMMMEWECEQPGRVDNIARGLRSVVPSHLADEDMFDFVELSTDCEELIPLTNR